MTDALKSFEKQCKRVLLNTINMPLKSEIYFSYSVSNMDQCVCARAQIEPANMLPFRVCRHNLSEHLVHFSAIYLCVSIYRIA